MKPSSARELVREITVVHLGMNREMIRSKVNQTHFLGGGIESRDRPVNAITLVGIDIEAMVVEPVARVMVVVEGRRFKRGDVLLNLCATDQSPDSRNDIHSAII